MRRFLPTRARAITAVAAFAAMSALALSSGGTGAAFTDLARVTTAVQAVLEFPCESTRPAPFTFDRAPVDHGVGIWTRDSALCSPDRRWIAVFQLDGNFVLYDTATTPYTARWATWTWSAGAAGVGSSLVLQSDGDLVVRDAHDAMLRHTYTAGITGPVTLSLDNAGVLVIRDAGGVARFSSQDAEFEDCRYAGFACAPQQPATS